MKKLLVLLLTFCFTALSGEMKPLKVGDEAPSFTLKNYDGKEHGLKKILKENKFTVLMFMSTECPVSNAYNERMESLHETYSKKGIGFFGLNANKAETTKDIAEHSKEHGFKFAVLKDEKNKVADLYGAQVTPEIFVLNPAGKLVYHGRIDDNRKVDKVQSHDLTDALDALLSGKEPSKSEAKAFGCTIKRISEE